MTQRKYMADDQGHLAPIAETHCAIYVTAITVDEQTCCQTLQTRRSAHVQSRTAKLGTCRAGSMKACL